MSFAAISTPRFLAPPLKCRDRSLEFGERTHLMGVVNVTPDSFSDGGVFFDADDAIEHGLELVDAGADIVDIGGESTRPGADPVEADEELDRVLPVIEAVAENTEAFVSVDTYKAEVARRAVDAGADIVNDISGLGFDDQMAGVVADTGCGLVLMHIRKTPETMQNDIDYDDVVEDIAGYFEARLEAAKRAGIDRRQIALDPGIGFGKTVDQNYRLLRELHRFSELGHPLVVGTSRKSLIGAVTDRPADDRLWGTAATVACSIFAGADIVRVHDVPEMKRVARVTDAICGMAP